MTPTDSRPLSGIRVLDLSRILAAPWTGQILADLGAEVIKVERPGSGDDTRGWGPPFLRDAAGAPSREAGYYLAVNAGKQSITVGIDTPEGQAIVRRLAADADIVLENYKVGTLARYGLDAASLRALNPRLIYCSVTGFGQDGPRAAQPAYDFLIQAMGGLMSVTGERDDRPGGGPQKVGVPIVDLMTGMYAAVGVLAALHRRAVSGEGETIDVAMLDVQVASLANQAMNHLISGGTPRRNGNAHPNIQPQDVYRCQDGEVILVVGNDRQFAQLCEVIGRPEWAAGDYATNAGRVERIDVLGPRLQAEIGRWRRADLVAALDAAGVPCGAINSVPEVLADPQVRARGMIGRAPHPLGVDVPLVESPLRFAQAPLRPRTAPPMLGEHSRAILARLGYTQEQIADLEARGIV